MCMIRSGTVFAEVSSRIHLSDLMPWMHSYSLLYGHRLENTVQPWSSSSRAGRFFLWRASLSTMRSTKAGYLHLRSDAVLVDLTICTCVPTQFVGLATVVEVMWRGAGGSGLFLLHCGCHLWRFAQKPDTPSAGIVSSATIHVLQALHLRSIAVVCRSRHLHLLFDAYLVGLATVLGCDVKELGALHSPFLSVMVANCCASRRGLTHRRLGSLPVRPVLAVVGAQRTLISSRSTALDQKCRHGR